MLGAIIGDIVGSRFEFNPTNDYNFELFGEGCSFTDDTICTIAVADALLKGRDYGESIHDWCRRYPNPMGGYGGRFRQWVMSDNPQPYGSYGNGSAMRVSPIAWWFSIQDVYPETRKSAECTHNHPDGILGASDVAIAIYECYEMRRESPPGKKFTPEDIRSYGLSHTDAFNPYRPEPVIIDLDEHRNKFDETCQGTVPVALWIVMHSTGFEDAIRQAVSLGGDADTLGAIVGSVAEAVWGIPEWMKQKALSYLPKEMVDVVTAFHERVLRRRKLSQRCEYYKVGEFAYYREENAVAAGIEKQWIDDLTKSYTYADTAKESMAQLLPIDRWQDWADQYDLPLSLIGYLYKHVAGNKKPTAKRVKEFDTFLKDNYSGRLKQAAEKLEENNKLRHIEALMFWKLGLGHMGKYFNCEDPIPSKEKIATAKMGKIIPMPKGGDDVSVVETNIPVTDEQMAIIRRGHIPEAQEDHWFMYATQRTIRYIRSWTGVCVFEASYTRAKKGYTITKVKIYRALSEFGVNGDDSAMALFRYLITAETGGNALSAWQEYMHEWLKLDRKYNGK